MGATAAVGSRGQAVLAMIVLTMPGQVGGFSYNAYPSSSATIAPGRRPLPFAPPNVGACGGSVQARHRRRSSRRSKGALRFSALPGDDGRRGERAAASAGGDAERQSAAAHNDVVVDGGASPSLRANPSEEEEEDRPYPFLSVILPLLLVSISNQWVRSALYYLVDFSTGNVPPPAAAAAAASGAETMPAAEDLADLARTAMNVGLGFNVEQYGLLASAAFTSLFAVASLVAGGLTDRYDRKTLAVGSCVAWSVATLGMSAARTYGDVVAMRALTGLSCAFAAPAAYTLLRDLVPARMGGTASAAYGSGVYVGEAMASLGILMDERVGWRGSLAAAGLFGLSAAAGAGWSLPPDRPVDRPPVANDGRAGRQHSASTFVTGKQSSPSLVTDAYEVLATSARVRWLFLAVFFRFCAGLLIGIWSAPYFRMAFPDDAESFSVVNAAIVGVCGVASGMIGGAASDRAGVEVAKMSREGGGPDVFDEAAGRLVVPLVGSVLAAPVWHMVVTAESFDGAMAWLAVKYLVAECWFGPAVAVLQSTVPVRLGGTAQGMFTLTGAVGNLAPSCLGVLFCWAADAAEMGSGAASAVEAGGALSMSGVGDGRAAILADLLSASVCGAYLLSAACFAFCALANSDADNDNG